MFVNENEYLFSVNEGHGVFVHVISSSLLQLRACLHGGGGPQIGEVTCGGSPHLSCKRDQIKLRDFVDRRVTHQSGLPHLRGVLHLHLNGPLGPVYKEEGDPR